MTTLAVLVAIVVSAGIVVATRRGIDELLLLTMAATAFTIPMNGLRVGDVMTMSDLLLVTAVFLLVVSRLMRPGPSSNALYRPFLLAVGVIVVGGVIGSLFGDESWRGVPDLIRFVISSAGLLLVFAAWNPTERETRTLAWALALGGVISVVLGVLFMRDASGRVVGLAIHSNHQALISLLAGGAAVGLSATSSGIRQKVAFGLSLVLLGGIIGSGSRASTGGLAVALMTFLLATRKWKVLRAVAVVAAAFTVLVMVNAITFSPTSAVGRLLQRDPTVELANEARHMAGAEAIDLVRRNPITGVGFAVAKDAHNVYLQFYAAAGALGIVGVAGIVVGVTRLLRWASRAGGLATAMLCSYVGYLGAAYFSNILSDRFLWFHLALTVALCNVAARHVSEPVGPPSTSEMSGNGRSPGDEAIRILRHARVLHGDVPS